MDMKPSYVRIPVTMRTMQARATIEQKYKKLHKTNPGLPKWRALSAGAQKAWTRKVENETPASNYDYGRRTAPHM